MAKEPKNEITWDEFSEQVAAIREAADQLDPPPEPDDSVGQATYGLMQNLESLEGALSRRVEREQEREEDSE